jgi:hypothetical protein
MIDMTNILRTISTTLMFEVGKIVSMPFQMIQGACTFKFHIFLPLTAGLVSFPPKIHASMKWQSPHLDNRE